MSICAQSIKSRKANIKEDIKLFGIDTKVVEPCEKLFARHNVSPNELDEMRSVLDACGVDMIWFQDSWYHENTWRIELRNAKIRSAIANGESRKVLKQGRHSVLVG